MPMTKYYTPVEKIYVINLDKSTDRLEAISKQLKAQNLEFTRFPAVMGLDLKIEDEHGRIFTVAI
jgi:GR25 family glycosyltransferase involved in LPS biosynthesis